MEANGFLNCLGKRIIGVLATSSMEKGGPISQVFLIFDDQTYFELYSNDPIHFTSNIYKGDIHQLHDLVKRDFSIVAEMYLDENMRTHFLQSWRDQK